MKVMFENNKGLKLAGILDKPSGSGPFPVVIGLHGFRSGKDTNKMKVLSDRLLAHGIAMFRFDFMGVGESEGDFKNKTLGNDADDVHSAIETLRDYDFIDKSRIGLFGSSMGGFVSILETARNKDVKALAMASPVTVFDWLAKRYTDDQIKEFKKTGMIKDTSTKTDQVTELKFNFIIEGRNHNTLKCAEEIKVPVLLVHGDTDEIVQYKDSERFFSVLDCDKKFVTIKGCEHFYEKKEHFEQLIEETVDFFKNKL